MQSLFNLVSVAFISSVFLSSCVMEDRNAPVNETLSMWLSFGSVACLILALVNTIYYW